MEDPIPSLDHFSTTSENSNITEDTVQLALINIHHQTDHKDNKIPSS